MDYNPELEKPLLRAYSVKRAMASGSAGSRARDLFLGTVELWVFSGKSRIVGELWPDWRG